MSRNVLITGGAGFIGSALARHLIADSDYNVLVVDKLTYAGTRSSLDAIENDGRFRFARIDVADAASVSEAFAEFNPDIVVHLAAESHVDRSIDGPGAFIETNIVGTFVLLQAALTHWRALPPARADAFRFHHVSTDEVFGALGEDGAFCETTPYEPRSPYSASKASSDHLVRAWGYTYGLPIVVTNCSNNYGPFQFPEKLIPLCIIKALSGEQIPIYGEGLNVRDWLFVDDHVRALRLVFEQADPGATFNVGGGGEMRNVDLVRLLCQHLDALRPTVSGRPYGDQIAFVTDRPGHDHRYAIDSAKLRATLGWRAHESVATGLEKTVRWYLDNEPWWRAVQTKNYGGQRLGLSAVG